MNLKYDLVYPHPTCYPGPFNIDILNNRHRFYLLLVSLYQIQPSKHKNPTKNFGPKN